MRKFLIVYKVEVIGPTRESSDVIDGKSVMTEVEMQNYAGKDDYFDVAKFEQAVMDGFNIQQPLLKAHAVGVVNICEVPKIV